VSADKNIIDIVEDSWRIIEPVLELHAPEVFATLRPGASSAELDDLERKIGVTLPNDLRRSLELHNGQDDPSRCLTFCENNLLMSAAEIAKDWQMLTTEATGFDNGNRIDSSTSNSIHGEWWRRSCIPFGSGEGDYACVDTISSTHGAAGRIVIHVHDDSLEETRMPSFADWLQRVAAALNDGKFDRLSHGFFHTHPDFAWTWNSVP
jgi:cell wall assembly regulator SMI1